MTDGPAFPAALSRCNVTENTAEDVVELFAWQLMSPSVVQLAPNAILRKLTLRQFYGRWFEYEAFSLAGDESVRDE